MTTTLGTGSFGRVRLAKNKKTGEFFAMKSYERPGVIWETPELILTEETFFFLKHMPDSPMPDCPSDASLASGSAPK